MNTVILHIEYLLRQHDCVVLPGWGAFIARHIPAHFRGEDRTRLLPPRRDLAFNPDLREDDGMIARSICRRNGVTYSEAMASIRSAVECLRAQLDNDGELPVGRLGLFVRRKGETLRFFPAEGAVNGRFTGLQPIEIRPLVQKALAASAQTVLPPLAPRTEETSEGNITASAHEGGFIRRNGVAIAASLAILITTGLFLLNPIRLDNEPSRASIAPTVVTEAAEPAIRPFPAPADSVLTIGQPKHDEAAAQTNPSAPRFNIADPWCVVIASFPNEAQAKRFMAENPTIHTAIARGKSVYRVYAATGSSQADALLQRARLGIAESWVCAK